MGEFVVRDFQLASVVEDKGFQNLIHELDKNQTPFHQEAWFKKKLFEEIEKNLKNKLKKVDHVNRTTDLWTSLSQNQFMAVTVHFIDPEPNKFELRSAIWGVLNVSETEHTGIC